MSTYLDRQLGFDEAPMPLPSTWSATHEAIPFRYRGDAHGHSHHGHSHGHGGGGPTSALDAMAVDSFETACALGDLAQAIIYWAQGTDIPNRRVTYGGSTAPPLMWASLNGHLPVMKFLVDRGAQVNFGTEAGQTAVMWAATEGHYQAVEFLASHGADLMLADLNGYTPMFSAVQNSNLAMLVLLVNLSGVAPSVEMRDKEGHTLLHWAAYRGCTCICEYLVDVHHFPLDSVDITKRTALIWAAREGHEETVGFLVRRNAKLLPTDEEGMTALQHAMARSHRATIATLAEGSYDTQADRLLGTTALVIKNRVALASALFGVAYVVLAFTATQFIPALLSYMAFGLYFGKNILFAFVFKKPQLTGQHRGKSGAIPTPESIADEIGMPRHFSDSVRSWRPLLRSREPANLCAFFTFLALQFSMFHVAEVPVTVLYWLFLSGTLGVLVYTKLMGTSSRQVIPSGTIRDSATIRAVEAKQFGLLHSRVTDQEKHIRVPLRAFYCMEIDQIVKRLDCFSTLLDTPIGEANHLSFVCFWTMLVSMQAYVLMHAWSVLETRHCSATQQYSTVYGFFVHALPCAVPGPDTTSWLSLWLPTSLQASGVWILQYALVCLVMSATVLLRQLGTIAFGFTRKEWNNPTAPTVDGTMVSIMRGRGHCIFSEGGPMTNLLCFVTGRFGERWRGLLAVPAPPEVGGSSNEHAGACCGGH